MAISPLYNSTTVRLMGISSGIDTESIIKQTLKLHQLKIDSQIRARTKLEWKQQSLNNIKTELTDFRRTFLTALGASGMRQSSVYNSTIATVTGKNAASVTIATSINTRIGTQLKIGRIETLATKNSVSSNGPMTRSGNGLNLNDKIGYLKFFDDDIDPITGDVHTKPSDLIAGNVTFDETTGEANVYINGATITLHKDDNINDINTKILAEGGGAIYFDRVDYKGDEYASINVNGKYFNLYGTENGGTPLTITGEQIAEQANELPNWMNFDAQGRAYVTINDKVIELKREMTIDEMMKKINSSGAGVTMTYDRFSDQFKLESNTTGESTIKVGGLTAFGINNGSYKGGSKASVWLNGVRREFDSNTFDIDGVRITLNGTTGKTGYDPAEDDINVSFTRDATEAVEKIKSFVDAFNVIISKLENLLKETKTRTEATYTPLTDEEKSAMSDKQIEEWEAIAKKGILRNDAGLQSLTNNLRNALFDQVRSAGLSPSQIGLTTGRWEDNTGGQIILDEDKLRAALEKDPDKVANVFMGGADDTVSSGRGLLWRMEDLMNGYIDGSQSTSLSNLEASIRKANEQMEKLQMKMYDEEDKLYKKFAAMETALSKIQSQSDWLTAMLSSFNNNK